ncbi:unnamed protein product, partial [Coregonus sp. 'balchen']
MVLGYREEVWNGPGFLRRGVEWSWAIEKRCGMVLGYREEVWNGPGFLRRGVEWSWVLEKRCEMVLGYREEVWNGPGLSRRGVEWSWVLEKRCEMVLGYREEVWNGPGLSRRGVEWSWVLEKRCGMVLGSREELWNGPGLSRRGGSPGSDPQVTNESVRSRDQILQTLTDLSRAFQDIADRCLLVLHLECIVSTNLIPLAKQGNYAIVATWRAWTTTPLCVKLNK